MICWRYRERKKYMPKRAAPTVTAIPLAAERAFILKIDSGTTGWAARDSMNRKASRRIPPAASVVIVWPEPHTDQQHRAEHMGEVAGVRSHGAYPRQPGGRQ